jgi:hypothetical protein
MRGSMATRGRSRHWTTAPQQCLRSLRKPENHIPTVLIGSTVRPGKYDQRIDHYNVLRMIEDFYGLPRAGASEAAAPIVNVFP